MDGKMKELLRRRKDRACATILGFKDEVCDEYLPKDISRELRNVILDQINDLYDFTLDVAQADTDGVVVNDVYLDRLEEIKRILVMSPDG